MRKRYMLVLAAISLASVGLTAAAESVTITRVSAPDFYIDSKDDFYGAYVGYRITNDGAGDLADVWVDIGSFAGTSVGLAPLETGLVRLGYLPAGTSKTAFFYLTASGEATGELHTISVYDGAPPATTLASQGFSLDVSEEIGASANHVSTVVHGPDPPGLGGILRVTVSGATGVMTGNPKILAFTPAARLDWPARSFQLIGTSITMTGGNPGLIQDELFRTVSSQQTSDYVAEYRFMVVNTTDSPVLVSPTVYVTSGGVIKHNGNTDYAYIQPVGSAQNRLRVLKSATPNQLSAADTVEYAITLASTNDSLTVVDDIVDTLPNTPALVTYVPGSSRLDGAVHADPVESANILQWNGPFQIPGMGSRVLRFKAVVPGTPGSYINRAVAHVGTTQIDTTASTTDDAPAIATVGLGSVDLQLSKTVENPTPAVGDTVRYTVAVTNAGPLAATGVRIGDLLPAGVTFLSAAMTQGGYVSGSGVWDTLSVAPGASDSLWLSVQIDVGTANTTITNQAAILGSDQPDPNGGNNTAQVDVNPVALGSIAGWVYEDVDHDAARTTGETGTGLSLYVKLVDSAAPGGPAWQAVAVDPVSGSYLLSGVSPGTYDLVVDDNANLTDVVSTVEATWMGTQSAGGVRAGVVVQDVPVVNQDFGLFHGGIITGVVFSDDGLGSSVANDGFKQAGEVGLSGITVSASTGGVPVDVAVSQGDGSYQLWIGESLSGSPLEVVESNPPAHLSTGGDPGTSGGSYDRAGDAITFVWTAGSLNQGLNFGDVPANQFLTDGRQTAEPGSVIFYTHQFVAGTAGWLSFTSQAAAAPALPAWPTVLYLDSDCDGMVGTGDAVWTDSLLVAAGETVCLVARVTVPIAAQPGAQHLLTVAAAFNYEGASPSLNGMLTRQDETDVGAAAGFSLKKTADRSMAAPGETVTYTLTFQNLGSQAIDGIQIHDATPAFTGFTAASVQSLPPGLTLNGLTTPPVEASGSITWDFTGALAPGAGGVVRFSVGIR